MIRELARAYIMIDGTGIVQNIAMFANPEDANRVARCCYGDSAYAEEYRWLVQAGDVCRDGVYYVIGEDGSETPAEYIPSDEENISQLQVENEALKEETAELRTINDELTIAMADMIGGAIHVE